jgi:hypothetical protein
MLERNLQLIFNEAICRRVKGLREARMRADKSWTAEKMASILGVPAANYRKYESRTPMPHYLIPKFAAIMGVTVAYVLTGKNERAAVATKLSFVE